MRRFLRRISPSMFQRLLLFMASGCAVVTVLLGWRLAHLTVAEGAMWGQRAELALVRSSAIPTRRGPILDRHGRVLAEDVPSYELAVRYTVISGAWAYDQARTAARTETDGAWESLTPETQADLAREHVQRFDAQAERLWDQLAALGGRTRSEIDDRLLTIQQRTQRMVSAVQRARLAAWDHGPDDAVRQEQIAQPIGEQVALHAVLEGIDDRVRMAALRWIADAHDQESHSPWQHVAVRRAKQRSYPAEAQSVTLARTSLPATLRDETPTTWALEGVGIHLV